uniref:Uncharacterized protein n=1 Tax=Rhizophora mucronata TaxID=61149 RepID=A0A2P2QJU9_RHIMU
MDKVCPSAGAAGFSFLFLGICHLFYSQKNKKQKN